MRHIHAHIVLNAQGDPALGWTYSHWILDFGKSDEPLREDVRIKCAKTSRRYMSQEEADAEARHRIRLRISQHCGEVPDDSIEWSVTTGDQSSLSRNGT